MYIGIAYVFVILWSVLLPQLECVRVSPPKVPRAVRLSVMCINLWDHHHHRPRSINNIRWRTVEGGGHKLIPPYHEMACLSLKISILITFFFYVKFKKKNKKKKKNN